MFQETNLLSIWTKIVIMPHFLINITIKAQLANLILATQPPKQGPPTLENYQLVIILWKPSLRHSLCLLIMLLEQFQKISLLTIFKKQIKWPKLLLMSSSFDKIVFQIRVKEFHQILNKTMFHIIPKIVNNIAINLFLII